jgi:hypothetical protein
MNDRKTRLTIEQLEDRIQPYSTGLPWPTANLTLSFVPDGTMVDGHQSSLFQTMGSQATTQAWEAQILKAAQTWASVANINIGLVADGGQPIGVAGLAQGDPRFGDIRVYAEPLGPTGALSLGTAYDPAAGTRSGDIVFNNSLSWGINSPTGYDIYTAALHELGNALALSENGDPTSAMCQTYYGPVSGLSASDITAIQALYGARTPDAYQGTTGNGTLATAAVMAQPEIAAAIGAANSTEYFQYTVPTYADSTLTVTVQTAGISLLTPGLSVYTASGQLISTSFAADPFSGTASITLNNVLRGTVLYFEVDSPASDVFDTGSYHLKVDTGAVSQTEIAAIDAVLKGTTIQSANVLDSTTSTMATAASLNQAIYQTDSSFTYATSGQLNAASGVDYFSLVTPATAPQAMIFTVTSGWGSTLSPNVTVYDANGNVVAAQVLSTDSTGSVVQILNPVANATYYVEVSSNAFAAGTYVLGVNYAAAPIVLENVVNSTLSATDTTEVLSMQSTQTQLYHFVLSVDSGVAASDVTMVMQLFDANNNLVLQLACQDGSTVSVNVLLQQGRYTLRFIGVSASGAVIPTTAYSLLGVSLTAPMDPLAVNPTDPTLSPTSSPTPPGATQSAVLVSDPIAAPILPPVDPNLLTALTMP